LSASILSQWSIANVAGIEFRYNTSPNVTSNFSITSISAPSTLAPWSFQRTKDQKSSAGKFENIFVGDEFKQYYRNSGGTFVEQREIWQITTTNLINGLSNRIGRSIPAADASTVIASIYGFYYNAPITGGAFLDGGMGRPPDIEGFVFWCNKYYSEGVSLSDIRIGFFAQSEPVSINNGSLSYSGLYTTGILSEFLATSGALSSGLISPRSVVQTIATSVTPPGNNLTSTGVAGIGTAESSIASSLATNASDSLTLNKTTTALPPPVTFTYEDQGDYGYFRGSDGYIYLRDTDSGEYYKRRDD
jgi:hypothetical protein